MWAIRTALDLGSHHPKAGIESYSATVIDMFRRKFSGSFSGDDG